MELVAWSGNSGKLHRRDGMGEVLGLSLFFVWA